MKNEFYALAHGLMRIRFRMKQVRPAAGPGTNPQSMGDPVLRLHSCRALSPGPHSQPNHTGETRNQNMRKRFVITTNKVLPMS
jgi:hypothetical protein